MGENPLVSVIIPTHKRPNLVKRAVESAQRQTYKNLEIIVVIDGPEDETFKILNTISDERFRVIPLEKNVGLSEARNTAVRAARGPWIAFLDDDDEWMPEKIERQMKVALRSAYEFPVVACSIIVRRPECDFLRPHNAPSKEQPISEYLFCRETFLHGPGFLCSIMLLVRRDLLMNVPFRRLKKNEDWDWILRVIQLSGVGLEFVPEPLAIYYIEDNRPSQTRTKDWNFLWEWLHSNRTLLTDRAFAGALLNWVQAEATNATFRERLSLLIEAFRSGSPRLMDVVCFFRIWWVPYSVRTKLRAFLTAVR